MDGKTHRAIGTVVGAGAALVRADAQEPWARMLEGVGGAVGGWLGAKAPDQLEPAVHSWHRSHCHSVPAASACVEALRRSVARWEAHCRKQATYYARLRRQPGLDGVSVVGYALAEATWRALAGLYAGFLCGYVSHLLLDATTPRGIPLVGVGSWNLSLASTSR